MSQVEFAKAIYTKLTGSGALDTNLSSRFHDTQAPSDADGQVLAELPLIFWTIVSDTSPLSFTRDDLDVDLQFDLLSKTSLGIEVAKANNDLLYELMNRATLTMVGFTGVQGRNLDRGNPSFEGDAIRIISQFNFFGTGS